MKVERGVSLKLTGVNKSFDHDGKRQPVLRAVDLELKAGEVLSIVGSSGCGKTTLLKAVAALLPVDSGTIALASASEDLPRIGFMFQNPPLLPWKTVLENVCFVASPGERATKDWARDCLKAVGLDGFAGHFPHQLSGGMKTRVALAQTMFLRPNLILLDEPFAFLDELKRDELNEHVLKVAEELGSTVLFVTHLIAEAAFLGDRIAVFTPDAGKPSIQAMIKNPLARSRRGELRRSLAFVELVENLRDELCQTVSSKAILQIRS